MVLQPLHFLDGFSRLFLDGVVIFRSSRSQPSRAASILEPIFEVVTVTGNGTPFLLRVSDSPAGSRSEPRSTPAQSAQHCRLSQSPSHAFLLRPYVSSGIPLLAFF